MNTFDYLLNSQVERGLSRFFRNFCLRPDQLSKPITNLIELCKFDLNAR